LDVDDYIALIRFEQFGNIEDIVNSSAERFFKPGTLRYGGAAGYEVDWSTPPHVVIVMKFTYRGVFILFRLTLSANLTNVAITHFSLARLLGDQEQEGCRMIQALVDARRLGLVSNILTHSARPFAARPVPRRGWSES
jgi:hypothetical protein